MNEEDRELLSAYLDGALDAESKRALEARLGSSTELRHELEELRGVGRRLKALPLQPLPEGFLVRFQARRARGDAPRREWTFLPPVLRPTAVALSCAVIALVLWNKVTAPPPDVLIHPPFAANVVTAEHAPFSQMSMREKSTADVPQAPTPARSIFAAGAMHAAGAPLEVAALKADRAEATASGGGGEALSEEDRSRRNEQNFANLELQKKKMGIARVLARKDASDFNDAKIAAAPALAANAPMALKGSLSSVRGSLIAQAESAHRAVPGRVAQDAGLIFSDARSLASSWIVLGFEGIPPAVDFTKARYVLIKPSGTKIVSVSISAEAVNVEYRVLNSSETPNPAQDRAAEIPLFPTNILILESSSQ